MAQVIKIKRSQTPEAEPSTLDLGELAANVADDPIRMWIGTGSGAVKELFAGAAVEDAENDAVYGRCNGDWVKVPIVGNTLPQNPPPNSMWFNSADGSLYMWYDDGTSRQWVGVSGGRSPLVVSPTPPANPLPDAIWCDSADMALYVFYQSQWVQI